MLDLQQPLQQCHPDKDRQLELLHWIHSTCRRPQGEIDCASGFQLENNQGYSAQLSLTSGYHHCHHCHLS
jgi:hypothetical protein